MDRPDRRTALSWLATSALAAGAGWPARLLAAPTLPWLATPDQIAAERMVLQFERDPAILAIRARLKADLGASARAHMVDGAATLDNAIAQWTRSLLFAELVKRPSRPTFLWATDDTSRTWLGHRLGGVGTSGDNPDAIYRMAGVEGGGRYEIVGRYHPLSKPAQLLIELDQGDLTQPAKIVPTAPSSHNDIQSASLITDREIVAAPDGSFRITVGGDGGGPNHLKIPPSGYCTIGVRDMLSDWRQRAAKLAIRRLDAVPAEPLDLATVRRRAIEDLDGYVRFWAHFPDIWMGSLKPNTHAEPAARPGGWGFVAGLNFHLAPDEALVVNLAHGEARYTGFQIIDPWMIAPDARGRQVCLNTSQSVADADGNFTYVIAPRDPGITNWLDTAGMRDGFGIMRWQAVPSTMTAKGLIRDFRVVKLAEASALPGVARVTPAERRARIAARTGAYNSRVR